MGARFDIAGVRVLDDERAVYGNVAEPASHSIGAVYTPPALAEWTATQLLRFLPSRSVLRVLDPACGDGELLASMAQVSSRPVELCGRDIDPRAIWAAQGRIRTSADFAVADSLRPSTLAGLGWTPDAVITNPPWGSPNGVSRLQIQTSGYELAKGQFDLYEIFVERLVKAFPNVPMAFILPDSLFLPEHTKLRRFLLEHSELLFLARLGEGLFPGIYRGTVVLVLRSGAGKDGDVECFRLQPDERRAFLTEGASLEQMRELNSYIVPRQRFASNPNMEFTLDVRADESAVDRMLAKGGVDWDEWLWIGRGIEIGKNGQTLHCDQCGTYRPFPKNGVGPKTRCSSCGTTYTAKSQIRQIVQHREVGGESAWNPVIVGEDVHRYRCEPTREVLIDLPGIRYGDTEMLRRPKLLVRKTGVGLRAAVDRSRSLTLQTVYHFIPKDELPDLVLDYLAGVLNSKVMLAFHLRWSGESEWRSHPYITPSTIKTLPVPTPFTNGTTLSEQAATIAWLARRRSDGEMVEGQIEALVEELFGLTPRERQWVKAVIGSAQSLRGIAEMRE